MPDLVGHPVQFSSKEPSNPPSNFPPALVPRLALPHSSVARRLEGRDTAAVQRDAGAATHQDLCVRRLGDPQRGQPQQRLLHQPAGQVRAATATATLSVPIQPKSFFPQVRSRRGLSTAGGLFRRTGLQHFRLLATSELKENKFNQ